MILFNLKSNNWGGQQISTLNFIEFSLPKAQNDGRKTASVKKTLMSGKIVGECEEEISVSTSQGGSSTMTRRCNSGWWNWMTADDVTPDRGSCSHSDKGYKMLQSCRCKTLNKFNENIGQKPAQTGSVDLFDWTHRKYRPCYVHKV